MSDSIYKPFTAREWAELEARHAARGGRTNVRADSTTTRHDTDRQMDAAGLFKHVEFDQAGRPITTFTLPEGVSKRESWLKPYMAPTMLMTAMTNNVQETRRQHQNFLREHGL